MNKSVQYFSSTSSANLSKNKIGLACIIAFTASLSAQALWAGDLDKKHAKPPVSASVLLPLTIGWYNGQQVNYIQTEASDQGVATQTGVNYVPKLANAINAQAVDDIFVVTNFTQGNVIASAPSPTGPDNLDQNYSPLWQVSTVTWNPGATPSLLTSEAAILGAEASGLVTISQKNIIVNCPVIFTPDGGLLPNAKIMIGHRGDEERGSSASAN